MKRVSKSRILGKPKPLENPKDFLQIVKKSVLFKHSKLREYKGTYSNLSSRQKIIVSREYKKFRAKNDISDKSVVFIKRGKRIKTYDVPEFTNPTINKRGKLSFIDDTGNIEIDRFKIAKGKLFRLLRSSGARRKRIIDALPSASHYSIEIGREGITWERGGIFESKKLLLKALNDLINRLNGQSSSRVEFIASITINSFS